MFAFRLVQGSLAQKKTPTSWDHHMALSRATEGSYGGVVSYERGTLLNPNPGDRRCSHR